MSNLMLPGLVDVHTHLRVPGGEHKEDFTTGTAAALAGGITTVLAMPNTSPPLTTPAVLEETLQKAQRSILCDVGLFAGASPEQIEGVIELSRYTVALKIYLNDTFGPLRVEDLPTLNACFRLWPRHKLIAMHAEGQSVAVGIGLAAAYQRPVHFCHISRKEEIELIAAAKAQRLPVTCEVTPHHLFLTEADTDRRVTLLSGQIWPRIRAQLDEQLQGWEPTGWTDALRELAQAAVDEVVGGLDLQGLPDRVARYAVDQVRGRGHESAEAERAAEEAVQRAVANLDYETLAQRVAIEATRPLMQAIDGRLAGLPQQVIEQTTERVLAELQTRPD